MGALVPRVQEYFNTLSISSNNNAFIICIRHIQENFPSTITCKTSVVPCMLFYPLAWVDLPTVEIQNSPSVQVLVEALPLLACLVHVYLHHLYSE
jgi:hypothetical protein